MTGKERPVIDMAKFVSLVADGDARAAYNLAHNHAEALTKFDILQWIEENRSGIEFEPGEVIYRDHFNSESLIAFIKGENK